jgi:hypothetical protein
MKNAHINPDGTVTLDVDPIRRLDIQDLDALDSFSRTTKKDVTTLKIKFADGGKDLQNNKLPNLFEDLK